MQRCMGDLQLGPVLLDALRKLRGGVPEPAADVEAWRGLQGDRGLEYWLQQVRPSACRLVFETAA